MDEPELGYLDDPNMVLHLTVAITNCRFCQVRSLIKQDDLRYDPATDQFDLSYTGGASVSSEAGRAGVEIKNALVMFYLGLVGVAADHNLYTGGQWIDIHHVKIMHQIKKDATELHQVIGGQFFCPCSPVHISAHTDCRRCCIQDLEEFQVTQVTRMKNMVNTSEGSNGFVRDVSVGVRYDSD